MKITKMTVGLKRDVRHEAYNVSQCRVEFTAELEAEDDVVVAYNELYDDVDFAVNKMVEEEKRKFNEGE